MDLFTFDSVKYKTILDIPALSICKHQVTTLFGASGGGKTTVLKLLNKLISPTQGRVLFNDEDLSLIPSVTHRRHVAMLSQTPVIFEGTIKDNLITGLKFQGRDIPDDDALSAVMDRVKLNMSLDGPANTLSGGEKQRLALGRVLLLDAEVYLLDEPSAALDENTQESIFQMVTKFIREGEKSLVMVTHASDIAEKFSDEILEIEGGSCVERRIQSARSN